MLVSYRCVITTTRYHNSASREGPRLQPCRPKTCRASVSSDCRAPLSSDCRASLSSDCSASLSFVERLLCRRTSLVLCRRTRAQKAAARSILTPVRAPCVARSTPAGSSAVPLQPCRARRRRRRRRTAGLVPKGWRSSHFWPRCAKLANAPDCVAAIVCGDSVWRR
jgi:hypothetical protein